MSAADGNEFIVNDVPNSIYAPPAIAFLTDGSFVIAWKTKSEDIRAQRFDVAEPGGAPQAVGPEFIVNHTVAGFQTDCDITALPDGGYVITWTNGDFPEADIYAQRFSGAVGAGGTPVVVGPEFTVNTTLTREQVLPLIEATPDGGYAIRWTSVAVPGKVELLTRHFSADVGPSGEPIPTTGETPYDLTAIGLTENALFTPLANGDYVAIWTSAGDVFGQRYDGDPRTGGSVSEVGALFSVTGGSDADGPFGLTLGWASVAPLADGGYVVAFTRVNNEQTSYDVFYQRYTAEVGSNGDAIRDGSTHMVTQATADYQWFPDAAASPEGGFVVTWARLDSDQFVETLDLYARSFRGDDAPVATDDTASVLKGGAVTLKIADLLANDSDPNDDTLTISAVGPAQHGTAILQGNNVVFYPEAGFVGQANFEYTLDDGHGNNGVGTVVVDVKSLQSVIGVINWVQTPNALSWDQANALAAASGGFLFRDVHPGTQSIANLSELIEGGGSVFYEQPTWFGAVADGSGWRWSTGEPIDELKFTAAHPDPLHDSNPFNDIDHPVLAGASWRAPQPGEAVDQVLMEFGDKASIKGTSGDDHFFGPLAAGQTLSSGAGNDQYWGPGGGTISLGNGNDHLILGEGSTSTPWTDGDIQQGTIISDGDGQDFVDAQGAALSAAIDGDNDVFANIYRVSYEKDTGGLVAANGIVSGANGQDELSNVFQLSGGSGNDQLEGFARLLGNGGDDILKPGATLFGPVFGSMAYAEGGDGNDTLYTSEIVRAELRGQNGNDTFMLAYAATVSGGPGNDTFVFTAVAPVVINDLSTGEHIDLSHLLDDVTVEEAFSEGYLGLGLANGYTTLSIDTDGGADDLQQLAILKGNYSNLGDYLIT